MGTVLDLGVSAEAVRIAALQQQPAGGPSRSVTLDRSALMDQLTDAICEYRGEIQHLPPAVLDSYLKAQQVIAALPHDIPDPVIEIDPDGEVSLDWWRGSRQCLSLSISGEGRITIAGLLGHEQVRERAPFIDQMPTTIISQIRRVVL